MKEERRLKAAKEKRIRKKKRVLRIKRTVVLSVELLILASLLGIGYIMNKYGKLNVNSFGDGDIRFNEGAKKDGYTTVALFGGDSREGQLQEATHADSIMVVSIDNKTGDVRIASVYRDIPLKQESGEIGKANSAYYTGGSKDAVNMLNRNLDLAIEDYVTVDFKALAVAVDLLGGIDADISEEEAAEMNNHIEETARLAGKETRNISAGKQTLDGVGVVTYARIRKGVGEDYARTQRQRYIISELANKIKSTDLSTVNRIIDEVFPLISTSFTLSDLISLAAGASGYKIAGTTGFPFEYKAGEIDGIGSVVIPIGFEKNVGELHAFLYPGEEYSASDAVKAIAAEVESVTGARDGGDE